MKEFQWKLNLPGDLISSIYFACVDAMFVSFPKQALAVGGLTVLYQRDFASASAPVSPVVTISIFVLYVYFLAQARMIAKQGPPQNPSNHRELMIL